MYIVLRELVPSESHRALELNISSQVLLLARLPSNSLRPMRTYGKAKIKAPTGSSRVAARQLWSLTAA